MERFEDLTDDFDLSRTLDDLRAGIKVLERTSQKNLILATALDQLGRTGLGGSGGHEGSYGYIPIDLNQFLDMLLALEELLAQDPDYTHTEKPHRPCSFLEVGCGIGRNLHVIRATDRFTMDKICGFDIEEEFITVGRAMFDLGEDIFVDDALTFDYGGYDVIYFYRPFHDDALQKQFETRLVETARRGAYILAQLDLGLDSSRSLVVKNQMSGIYKRL